jgi:sulfite exporter TauE/SafE/copper chaperone CopZ/plastocyanin
MPENAKEHIYYVKGMHCASCEILIEKKLLTIKGVKSVEAKADKGEVLVEYIGKRPKTEILNSIFRKENYVFFDQPAERDNSFKENNFFKIFIVSVLLIVGFLYLNKSVLFGWINVNSKSSLPAFFVLGLIAGVSSCAALVGGLILSMSKQWLEIYPSHKSILTKLQPHLMFHAGRIVSYGILGAILGVIGSRLQISLGFTSLLIIVVSIVMILLALQMLGVKSFRKFQFTLPKFTTRYIADETNFKGRYMPFIMGALTFFLPCGFTITSQGLALISGNPLQGGLIMAFFALGTALPLLLIGFSSIKFSSRPHLAYQFSKIAGVLILFFALFNINNQLNVLGYSSFSDFFRKSTPAIKNIETNSKISDEGLAPIVNGKQLLKMDALAYGYEPNYFKVRAGAPVRWEITDKGTSGCTNAVISKSLFDGEIPLTPGQTSIKEFTPAKPGKYKFSCWMGMISGIIEVVDETGAAAQNGNLFTPSGAESSGGSCGINGRCGCGGR